MELKLQKIVMVRGRLRKRINESSAVLGDIHEDVVDNFVGDWAIIADCFWNAFTS